MDCWSSFAFEQLEFQRIRLPLVRGADNDLQAAQHQLPVPVRDRLEVYIQKVVTIRKKATKKVFYKNFFVTRVSLLAHDIIHSRT